jgi:hypothetical protein
MRKLLIAAVLFSLNSAAFARSTNQEIVAACQGITEGERALKKCLGYSLTILEDGSEYRLDAAQILKSGEIFGREVLELDCLSIVSESQTDVSQMSTCAEMGFGSELSLLVCIDVAGFFELKPSKILACRGLGSESKTFSCLKSGY